MSVDHYENFPVATWLCPAPLRPAVTAIYHFARTADDIADEGDAPAAERVAQLDAYERALRAAALGQVGPEWNTVFAPLARAMHVHALPLAPFTDLLSAFRQDTANPLYPDREALLDYCARSANPIGRLLLHLAGIEERMAAERSDAICTALQMINFWQDLSVDLPRGRCYVPLADLDAAGIGREALRQGADSAATRGLVRELCRWARALMLQGAPLVHRMPGRFGWELRLVVQGGLRVLEKIERADFGVLSWRPTVGKVDAPRVAWRALRMGLAAPREATVVDPPRRALR